MTKETAIQKISFGLMQIGMLMPISWVEKNGPGSEFMEACEMAIAALRSTPEHTKGAANG